MSSTADGGRLFYLGDAGRLAAVGLGWEATHVKSLAGPNYREDDVVVCEHEPPGRDAHVLAAPALAAGVPTYTLTDGTLRRLEEQFTTTDGENAGDVTG